MRFNKNLKKILLRSSRLQGAGVKKSPLEFWTCGVISGRAKAKPLIKQNNN